MAFAEKTRVRTPAGWAPIETFEVGDFVKGPNGEKSEILAVARATVPTFRVETDDGRFVITDADQVWILQDDDGSTCQCSTLSIADSDPVEMGKTWKFRGSTRLRGARSVTPGADTLCINLTTDCGGLVVADFLAACNSVFL